MASVQHFIEPLDVLYLRGNKLFGAPGSYGELVLPPWPSVAAGALRSALLVHKDIDVSRFARREVADPELGTPDQPGTFKLTALHLARREAERIELLFQPPADVVIGKRNDGVTVQQLSPHTLHDGILCSQVTTSLAVLAETERGKPESGFWLTANGWERYLCGETIDPNRHLVRSEELWHQEMRVGIGLEASRGRAAEGALFSMETVSLRKAEHRKSDERQFDVGFLVETVGAQFPESVTLRFGGDSRGAVSQQVKADIPQPDYNAIAHAGRCRLILATPGVFTRGWQPTGTVGEGVDLRFELHGVKGRLMCAAVPRAEVISGFDIAKGMPKPAQRVAPTGSVYWLDDLETTADALHNLVARGLWSDPVENESRHAEGFNRVAIGAWMEE